MVFPWVLLQAEAISARDLYSDRIMIRQGVTMNCHPLCFDETEILEQLICQSDTAGFLGAYEAVKNSSKMLHNKLKRSC
jgi:hypothetical protein